MQERVYQHEAFLQNRLAQIDAYMDIARNLRDVCKQVAQRANILLGAGLNSEESKCVEEAGRLFRRFDRMYRYAWDQWDRELDSQDRPKRRF